MLEEDIKKHWNGWEMLSHSQSGDTVRSLALETCSVFSHFFCTFMRFIIEEVDSYKHCSQHQLHISY